MWDWKNWVHRKENPLKPRDRDDLAKHRKLEAIEAELARHRRRAHVALLLVVLLDAMLLAMLAYHLFGQD
jgi:hypothetical protein